MFVAFCADHGRYIMVPVQHICVLAWIDLAEQEP